MSGLERTADALLERKAVQQSNHQRAQGRIDDTVLKIRTHMVNARAATGDIERLTEEMTAHAEEYQATDDSAALLADRHTLQTAATNAETERAVAFGSAFKALHDVNNGLVDRVLTAIDVGTAMTAVIREHSRYLEECRRVGEMVEALALQTNVVALCSSIAGHSHTSHQMEENDEKLDEVSNTTTTAAPHPLLSWWHSLNESSSTIYTEPIHHNNDTDTMNAFISDLSVGRSERDGSVHRERGPQIASSTAEWNRHIALVSKESESLENAIAGTKSSRHAAEQDFEAKRLALAVAKSQGAEAEERAETLRAMILAAKSSISEKAQLRKAIEKDISARLTLEAEAQRIQIAQQETAIAQIKTEAASGIKVIEEQIAKACDEKHDVSSAVERLAREQSDLKKSLDAQQEKNTSKKRAVIAKAVVAQRTERLFLKAARRVLDLRSSVDADAALLAAEEEKLQTLIQFFASKEEAAMRYEWGVEHAKEMDARLLQLAADESNLRVALESSFEISFSFVNAHAELSVLETNARAAIANQEEVNEWQTLASTIRGALEAQRQCEKERERARAAEAEAEAAAAAAKQAEEEALTRKRMREEEEEEQREKERHRDARQSSAARLESVHRYYSQQQQSSQQNSNNNNFVTTDTSLAHSQQQVNIPSTPSRHHRGGVGIGQYPTATPSKTLLNAQALLANTSSLLAEASKPIPSLLTSHHAKHQMSGAMGGSHQSKLLLLSGTPRRGGNATNNSGASALPTPMPARPRGAIPLPPNGSAHTQKLSSQLQEQQQQVVIVASNANENGNRGESEESVISLFRSVSMPQQQQLVHTHQQQMLAAASKFAANLIPQNNNNTNNNNTKFVSLGQRAPPMNCGGATIPPVPSSIANWHTVPPSPTPTDLGGGTFSAAFGADQRKFPTGGGFYATSGDTPAVPSAAAVGLRSSATTKNVLGTKRGDTAPPTNDNAEMGLTNGGLASTCAGDDESDDEVSLSRLLPPPLSHNSKDGNRVMGNGLRAPTAAAAVPYASSPKNTVTGTQPTLRLSGGKSTATAANGNTTTTTSTATTPRRASGRSSGGSGGAPAAFALVNATTTAASSSTATTPRGGYKRNSDGKVSDAAQKDQGGRTSPSPRRPRKAAALSAAFANAVPTARSTQQPQPPSSTVGTTPIRKPLENITNSNSLGVNPAVMRSGMASSLLPQASSPSISTKPSQFAATINTPLKAPTTRKSGGGSTLKKKQQLLVPSARVEDDDFNTAFGL